MSSASQHHIVWIEDRHLLHWRGLFVTNVWADKIYEVSTWTRRAAARRRDIKFLASGDSQLLSEGVEFEANFSGGWLKANAAEKAKYRLYKMRDLLADVPVTHDVKASVVALIHAEKQATKARRILEGSGVKSPAAAKEFATIGAVPAGAVNRFLDAELRIRAKQNLAAVKQFTH